MDTAPTATLPREEPAAIDPGVREHVYVSPHSQYAITVRPKDDIPMPGPGGKTRYQRVPGKRAEFLDGILRTRDQEIIDFLADHPRRGTAFREVTAEQPKPPSGPVLNEVIELTGHRNVEAIQSLLHTERHGDAREDVLLAAERALEVLGATVPEGPIREEETKHAEGGVAQQMGAAAGSSAGVAPADTQVVGEGDDRHVERERPDWTGPPPGEE